MEEERGGASRKMNGKSRSFFNLPPQAHPHCLRSWRGQSWRPIAAAASPIESEFCQPWPRAVNEPSPTRQKQRILSMIPTVTFCHRRSRTAQVFERGVPSATSCRSHTRGISHQAYKTHASATVAATPHKGAEIERACRRRAHSRPRVALRSNHWIPISFPSPTRKVSPSACECAQAL